MPFTICLTSMLPPFSRGGIVRRQRSLSLPVGPHTSFGSASFGSGGSTKPPAFMRASSRWNMRSVSFGPGAVPIVPVNPLNRTFTPGMSGDVAVGAGEVPPHDMGVREEIPQEAEAGDDDRVAELVGHDVPDRHREHVAGLGAVHEQRPRQRVHEVEVRGRARRRARSCG